MTQNFSYKELTYSDTAIKHNIANTPSEDVLKNIQRCAYALEYLRMYLGNNPIIVTSGYRCRELNARIGGSPTSSHIDGEAFDFKPPNSLGTLDTAIKIFNSDILFDQLIIYKSFLHIGFGNKKRRQLINRLRS